MQAPPLTELFHDYMDTVLTQCQNLQKSTVLTIKQTTSNHGDEHSYLPSVHMSTGLFMSCLLFHEVNKRGAKSKSRRKRSLALSDERVE